MARKPKAPTMADRPRYDGYHTLENVLDDALVQAAVGKGDERHAGSRPFHKQPMQQVAQMEGVGFLTGQAIKKINESKGLKREGATKAELLGAINYLAGAVIYLESLEQE